MSQKTLNLCLERYNFVKFGETTKSSHTVLCINNAYSVNSDKYRLTPAAIASKHGEGYVFTLNYDFDRPLFTIVQKSYALDGTSGNIVFEGIDPISKGGSKYLRKVTVSPVKLSDGSYLLEVTKDEYLRIGTTGAVLGDEELESLNEKIVTVGGIEKSVETVGGRQVLKLDGSGPSGKEIVYFDIDPSDPPSGIYEAIGEALSSGKLPAIRSDGKLYQYTSTDTDRHDFVGMFGHSDVGYEVLTVWIGDAVNVNKIEASLGYTAVPSDGTEEHPAWAKVCELDPQSLLGYTSYGLALLFTSVSNNDGANVESGLFVVDVGSNWHSNSNGCNASWISYTPNSDEYSKILGIKLIGKYGVPSNPVLAPYPIYKVEVWVKYYGSNEILVNALQNAFYNYNYGTTQGLYYKFPEDHIATPQSTEPSYSDTEEYKYKNFFYPAESPNVAYTHAQSLTSEQKTQGRDNIGAASASDVTVLQSQVSSLSDVSAYSVKGEATVAQLNAGPSGIQAGWSYQLTDSGTLTDGNLAVVAGDTVAWDGTKWFPLVKSDYYATKTYAQNVAHSIAPEFDPTRDYVVDENCTYEGTAYIFTSNHPAGAWNPAHATISGQNALIQLTTQNAITQQNTFQEKGINDADNAPIGSILFFQNTVYQVAHTPNTIGLVVTFSLKSDSSKFKTQMCFNLDTSNPRVFVRHSQYQGTWLGWVELMNSASSEILDIAKSVREKGNISVADLNSVPNGTVFFVNNLSVSNLPVSLRDGVAHYGNVMTFNGDVTNTTNYTTQIYCDTSGDMYLRVKTYEGTWTAWSPLISNRNLSYVPNITKYLGSKTSGNLNDLASGTLWWVQGELTNMPVNPLNGNAETGGNVLTFNKDSTGTGTSTYKTQVFYSSNNYVYTRFYRYGGTWTAWRMLADAETLDLVYSRDFKGLTLGMYEKVGVVGDSFASGLLYTSEGVSQGESRQYSWPQIAGRLLGCEWQNFTLSGISTRTWLTNQENGLPKLLDSTQKDLYILALGINDVALGSSYLGDITDITGHESYTDYPDTFYGNYGKIIEQILEYATDAKLVITCMANNSDATREAFNGAISAIATHYEIPCLLQYNDPYFKSETYTTMYGSHPTKLGYSGMARALVRMIEDKLNDTTWRTYFNS